jgi:hypothetical protein
MDTMAHRESFGTNNGASSLSRDDTTSIGVSGSDSADPHEPFSESVMTMPRSGNPYGHDRMKSRPVHTTTLFSSQPPGTFGALPERPESERSLLQVHVSRSKL